MNIYDKAHDLVGSIKKTPEYSDFMATKKILETDEKAKAMVKEFITKQMQLEYEMMGEKSTEKEKADKMQEIQQLHHLISGNSKAVQFMTSYLKFQRIVADIYKILGDSIGEGMDFFDKK